MFCPKCGQQQADEARFCSRCGFALAGVSELLMRGGQLPTWPAAEMVDPQVRRESPKRKGVRQGGGLMLISVFLIPMLAILHRLIGLPRDAVLFGVLLFMCGMLRMLYSLFFAAGAPASATSPQQVYAPPVMSPLGAVRQDALPPAQGTPVYAYRPPQVHTAEMRPPPSVTDHTTRLLDRQRDAERGEP